MSLKFFPPKEEAKGLPKYASYVVGSGMKLHRRVCDAKNSFNNRGWTRVPNPDYKDGDNWTYRSISVTRHSFILENVDGKWYTLYEIPEGTKHEDLPWMKEHFSSYGTSTLITDYHRNSRYYQEKFKSGEYKIFKKATPMSTDEYVQFRLAIQREQLGIHE